MSIELRVAGRQQISPMSCWWASTAMVLEYYGQRYYLPHDYREEFRRPFYRFGYGGLPDMVYPSLEHSDNDEDINRYFTTPIYMQPYEWYRHGLLMSASAFRRYTEITGFRGIGERPAFGSWTANNVETILRRCGPLVFFGRWNGLPHSVVVVGSIMTGDAYNVVTIDPVRGFATSDSLANFNRNMSRIMVALDGLNPFYYPAPPQVRATVVDD